VNRSGFGTKEGKKVCGSRHGRKAHCSRPKEGCNKLVKKSKFAGKVEQGKSNNGRGKGVKTKKM
jgi:hypothetical protein